jgi:hypothetical protein
MMKPVFTKADVGCWIDGAFGPKHRREKLVCMLEDIADCLDASEWADIQALTEELESTPSDDYGEEEDAIEILQDYTEEGLVWIQDGGDLILTTEEEAEFA